MISYVISIIYCVPVVAFQSIYFPISYKMETLQNAKESASFLNHGLFAASGSPR